MSRKHVFVLMLLTLVAWAAGSTLASAQALEKKN
jgi:hypothetical protein